jgi:hypothetical protein
VSRVDKGYDETISVSWDRWSGKRVIVDNVVFWFAGVQTVVIGFVGE